MDKESQKLIFFSLTTIFGGGETYIKNLNDTLRNIELFFAICSPQLKRKLELQGVPNKNIFYMPISGKFSKLLFILKALHFTKKNGISKCALNGSYEVIFIPLFFLLGVRAYPVIHTEVSPSLSWIKRLMTNAGYHCSTKIICIAAHIADQIPSIFDDKKLTILNRVGSEYQLLKKVSIRHEMDEVIFIGRVARSKGVEDFLELAKYFPNVMFKLIGPIAEECYLAQYNNQSNVHFIGYDSDVQKHLRTAGVAMFPSRSEGLPYAVLEAASIGLPIVATEIPGHREISRQIAGISLYKPGDINSLVAVFEQLRDASVRRKISRSIFKDATRFNDQKNYEIEYSKAFDFDFL